MAENKDWTGGSSSIWKTIGASNHTDKERQQHDFYASHPSAIDRLLKKVQLPHNIWECACGQGDLSKRLEQFGYNVVSTDIVDRGYGECGVDFLNTWEVPFEAPMNANCAILTNPPYRYATEFVEHALQIAPYDAMPVFMLLKTTFLEGKKRYEMLYRKGYLQAIYQFTGRLLCAKNGDFERMSEGGGSAVSYAWYRFQRTRCDAPRIYWI